MTELQMTILFADLALIVMVAWVIGHLARMLGQPAVIGEILGAILVGPTLFHGQIATTLFPLSVRPYLGVLANLGLVLFMFIVGLEFDFHRLRGSGRIAGATAVSATVVPFSLGLLLALYLARSHHPSDRPSFTLFVGVAVSVTAFPVLARILTDREMTRTRLGTIALSAAAISDLAAWTVLALIQAIHGGGYADHWRVLLVVPFVAVLFLVVRPLLARLLIRSGAEGAQSLGSLAIMLAALLMSASVTQLLGLHFVFGAFLFGLAVPRLANLRVREDLMHRTQFATILLLPVYFILAGLNVDLSRLGGSGLLELVLIMVVAITGKFGGTWLAACSQGLVPRDSAVLATLMNTRGLTELIVLNVGLQIGLLDAGLYSLMVVMAVVTTAMTGPVLRVLMRQKEAVPAEPALPDPVGAPPA
jgi:Kef-type K+ transport system membrane component KefB